MVTTGDTLFVTSTRGDELRVQLESVDATRDLLLVSVDGIPLDLPARGIRAIDRQQRDSLKDGALIGLAHGLGAALLLTAISRDDTAGREFLAYSVLCAPLGAGIGAANDSAHKTRDPVYRRHGGSMSSSFDPLRASRQRGLSVSMRFVW